MRFSFLTENKTDHEGVLAEHGLSIYIDTGDKKILLDSGASDIFASNAESIGVDLSDVDLAVVSHGHSDHTGGFPLFCRINEKAPIYIHKNAFRASHGFSGGKIEEEMCGIKWSDSQKETLRERMILTDGPCHITDDIVITGTVPISEDFKPTERFYYYDPDGQPVEDDMSHEQSLVIRSEEGLYVFSGCCHRGVISNLEAARKLFPGEKVALFVAGMHLYGSDAVTRAFVIDQIMDEEIDRVMPVHCTGLEAICDMKALLKDRCKIAQAGDTFDGC